MLPVLALALALVIGGAVIRHRQSLNTAGPAAVGELPVPPDVMDRLSSIPEKTWDAAGAKGAERPTRIGAPQSGATAPLVLYVGAEYCPYCAALRWSLVAALARFGHFTGLALSASSATDVFPRTPTFTFLRAQYQSPSVDLQAVELAGNVQDASGRYPPLQHLTREQTALLRRHDPRGEIPFMLVGGQYLWVGSPFSPGLLQGADWHTIAEALPVGLGAAAHAILTNANEITAAVCAVNNRTPAAVCDSAGVREAARTLPRTGPP